MTDRELNQKLKNFPALWQRVQDAKPQVTGGAKLMPGKDKRNNRQNFDYRK